MIPQLTKEMLLERVNALADGTFIDSELLSILTTPDNSPNMIDTIKRLNRTVSNNSTTRYIGENPSKIRNDLVKKLIEIYPNVIDIQHPNVGVNPKNPKEVTEIGGIGWELSYKELGLFPIRTADYLCRENNDEAFIENFGERIKKSKWVYVYLCFVEEKLGVLYDGNLTHFYTMRLRGVTQEELDNMKTYEPKIELADYVAAGKINISMPPTE